MPDSFYFLLAFVSVNGFLLIGLIVRINRRRNNRRVQQGIADYLLQKTAAR